MPGWTAILLATPMFGMQLTPPALDGAMLGTPTAVVEFAATLPMPGLLQVDDATPQADGSVAVARAAPVPEPLQTPEQIAQAEEDRRYTEEVIRRREIGQIHRAF